MKAYWKHHIVEIKELSDIKPGMVYIDDGQNIQGWVFRSELSFTDWPREDICWHNKNPHKSLLVIDNFYKHPDEVRELALNQDYVEDLRYYKGLRSKERFLFPKVRETFQDLLQSNITDWLDQSNFNGVFQQTSHGDPLVYHSDLQSYAAAIYLNASYDLEGGTSFWRHIQTGQMDSRKDDPANSIFSAESVIDSTQWELVDKVAPVYNRLVIWDSKRIHSASSYQSYRPMLPRLVQLFFFNVAAQS